MKKIFEKIYLIGILTALIYAVALPISVFAQVPEKTPADYYLPTMPAVLSEQYQDELVNAENLPAGDIPVVFSIIADILLGITGSIAMVALIYTGILYVTARGDDTQLDKAKNILLYIIVGLVVIAASYANILGISSLSFD